MPAYTFTDEESLLVRADKDELGFDVSGIIEKLANARIEANTFVTIVRDALKDSSAADKFQALVDSFIENHFYREVVVSIFRGRVSEEQEAEAAKNPAVTEVEVTELETTELPVAEVELDVVEPVYQPTPVGAVSYGDGIVILPDPNEVPVDAQGSFDEGWSNLVSGDNSEIIGGVEMEEDETEDVDAVDVADMTLAELRTWAKTTGVDTKGLISKADFVRKYTEVMAELGE